jgi:predicted kinase
MAILYVMCGVPGSGKSTWARKHLTDNDVYVSRDDIRFSFLNEGDDYFSKEDMVWDTFVKSINEALEMGYNVFADATHINPGSRRKLLNALKFKEDIDVRIIHVDTPVAETIARNELRKDTNRYVPISVIQRMSQQFEKPEFSEGFSTIYTVKSNGKIEIQKEAI